MKKTSKSTSKKPAQKKTATNKSSSKTKRKADSHSELTQVVERLDAIMDKLNELLERMAELTARPSHHQQETPRQNPPPDFSGPSITAAEDGEPENGTREQ